MITQLKACTLPTTLEFSCLIYLVLEERGKGIFLLFWKNELIRSSEGKSFMRLFQVEGSMNVGMKGYVCIEVGQRVLGIHHLFKLANPKTEGRA